MASFVPLARHLRAAVEVSYPKPGAPATVPAALPPAPDPAAVARERAHAEAMASLAAAEAEARAAAAALKEAARVLTGMRGALLEEARAGTAAVVRAAACRIAGDALHTDAGLLQALVDEAIRALGKDGLVVHVSPSDADMLRDVLGDSAVEVVEDFGVEAGCVFEGPAGRIDASIESAVAAVNAVLDQWKG